MIIKMILYIVVVLLMMSCSPSPKKLKNNEPYCNINDSDKTVIHTSGEELLKHNSEYQEETTIDILKKIGSERVTDEVIDFCIDELNK